MVRTKPQEGAWFGVPLRDGSSFGVGVIARANPRGVLLGYFFGPRRRTVPSLDEISGSSANDAVLVAKFGDLGIRRGTWPVIGENPHWDRRRWPMPVFLRYEELSGRSFHVTYDPDDPSKRERETEVPPGSAEQLPKDGLLGAGLVEKILTTMLQ